MKKQIKKHIVILYFIAIAVLMLGAYIVNIPVQAQSYEAPVESYPIVFEVEYDWTTERIKKEIDDVALEYGVSAKVMHTVINCESNYKKTALGDGGKSRGLAQIHSGYHDVKDEDAYDPHFAIRFLAEKLSNGQGYLWSCYNQNY